jgi:hypothetical protein
MHWSHSDSSPRHQLNPHQPRPIGTLRFLPNNVTRILMLHGTDPIPRARLPELNVSQIWELRKVFILAGIGSGRSEVFICMITRLHNTGLRLQSYLLDWIELVCAPCWTPCGTPSRGESSTNVTLKPQKGIKEASFFPSSMSKLATGANQHPHPC